MSTTEVGALWSMQMFSVLSLFRHGERLHGYAVVSATGIAGGTVYPMLGRMAGADLLIAEKERVDPSLSSRVPRTIYRLSTVGRDQLKAIRDLVST